MRFIITFVLGNIGDARAIPALKEVENKEIAQKGTSDLIVEAIRKIKEKNGLN
jgi:HEAT repeat protein